MTCIRLCSLIVFAASLATTATTYAQGGPPPGGGPGGVRPPQPPPSNLKVLPKDISRGDLIKLMGQYRGDLGVECSFCHAQNPETKRTDFASDANPMKDKARFMIAMTDDLNKKYIGHIPGGKQYSEDVTCGTCHRGESHPSAFVPKPQERPAGAPPGGGAAGGPQPPR